MRVPANKKNFIRTTASVIAACWVFSSPAAESIYKWVDEEGNVHFSDHPPTQVNDAKKLRIEAAPSDDIVREAQARRDDLQAKQRSSHDQRIVAREQKRMQAESERTRRDDRQQRCTNAHEEIQNLNHHMPVYYFDETGNRVFLDDKRRADLIEFYRRETKMFCD